MNRFQAAAELLGHRPDVKHRKANGTTTYWWGECDCGWKSSEYRNSQRTAIGSAIGHAKRVADRLRLENDGVSLPPSGSNVGGRS